MILAELPSWVEDLGKSILWIAGIMAALGIIFKVPWIKRPGQWVWKRLVSNPLSEWGKRTVAEVVESYLVESRGKGETGYNFIENIESNQKDMIASLNNIHACLERRFTETHDRINQISVYTQEVLAEAVGAKERIRQLYRALEVPVFESSAVGHFTYVNPAFAELSGLGYEDSLGEGWVENIHADDRQRVFKAWGSAVKSAIDFNTVFRYTNSKTSATRMVRASARPLHDGAGNVVGWVGTLDPTETESTNLETQ